MFSNAGKGGKKALQATGIPSLFAAPPRSFRDDIQSAKFGQKPTFQAPILAPVVAPISPKQTPVNLQPTKKSSIYVNYFASQNTQQEDSPPVVVNNPIAEKAPEIVSVDNLSNGENDEPDQAFHELEALHDTRKENVLKYKMEVRGEKQSVVLSKEEKDDLIMDKNAILKENLGFKSERNDQKDQVDELNKEMEEICEQLKSVLLNLDAYKITVPELEKLNKFYKEKIISEAKQSKQGVENFKHQLETKCRKLEAQIDTEQNEINRLDSSTNNLDSNIMELNQQMFTVKSKLQGQINELESSNLMENEEIDKLNEMFPEFEAHLAFLEDALNSVCIENGALDANLIHLTQFETKFIDLEMQLAHLEQQFDDLELEKEQILSTIENHENQIIQLESTVSEKSASIEGVSELNERLEEQIDELSASLENGRQQIEQLEMTKNEMTRTNQNLSNQKATFQLEISQLITENNVLNSQLSDLAAEKDQQKQAMENIQVKLGESQQTIRALTDQLQSSKTLISKVDNTILKLNNENTALTGDMYKLQFAQKNVEKEMQIAVNQKAAICSNYSINCGKLKATKEKFQAAQNQMEKLNADWKMLQQTEVSYNLIQNQLSEMIKSNEGFHKIISEKDVTIGALQLQVVDNATIIEMNKEERDSMCNNIQQMLANAIPTSFKKPSTPVKANSRISISKAKTQSLIKPDLKLVDSSTSEFLSKSPSRKSSPETIFKSPVKSILTSYKRKLKGEPSRKMVRFENELPRYSAKDTFGSKGIDMSFIKDTMEVGEE